MYLLNKYKVDQTELKPDNIPKSPTCTNFTCPDYDEMPKLIRNTKMKEQLGNVLKKCSPKCEFTAEDKSELKKMKKQKRGCLGPKSISVLKERLWRKQNEVMQYYDHADFFDGSKSAKNLDDEIHPFDFLQVNGVYVKNLEYNNKDFLNKHSRLIHYHNHRWESDGPSLIKPSKVTVNLRRRKSANRNPITWEIPSYDTASWRKFIVSDPHPPLYSMTVSDTIHSRPAVKCRKMEVIRNPITGEEVNFTRR
uniref:Uncharacterized protein n=1 Tax=Strigamia maritima TaxID=126957 RepID=T1ITB3_STRMM